MTSRPASAVDQALSALRRERHFEALQPPLAVLSESDDPRVREALLAKFQSLATRGDTGCAVRAALLHALCRHVTAAELPLLEEAVRTYELDGKVEVAANLRANALLAMNEIDPDLAGYHAVRLIHEAGPGVVAVQLLASQGQFLPLYDCALRLPSGSPEVLGECLRSLTAAPLSVLAELVERHRSSEEETVLLGLFDLLLARGGFADCILDFLRTTSSDPLFQWLVSTIVAQRREDLLPSLREMAETEPDRTRRNILRDSLALL